MDKKYTYQDKEIWYKIQGQGRPVLLLHGFGEDSRIWDKVLPLFDKNTMFIIADIPGSGRSAIWDGKPSLKEFGKAFFELPELKDLETFTVLGHSMGGYISMAMAALHPEKIDGLGLLHSSAYADNDEKIESRKKGILFMQAHGAAEFLNTAIPGLFANPEKDAEALAFAQSIGKEQKTEAAIQYYHAMMERPDTTRVFYEHHIPVLMIQGEHDKAVPIQAALEQSHLPEKAWFYILKNSGHLGMLEEPELFAKYLNEYLTQTAR